MTIKELIKALEEYQDEHSPDTEVTIPTYIPEYTRYISIGEVYTTMNNDNQLVVCII